MAYPNVIQWIKDLEAKIGGGGVPLFSIVPMPFATVQPGFLSVTVDNGILTAAAFPEAYAQLVLLQSNGETNIVTMAEYAAELAANGGICGRFALDTDAQTFRIPCAPGAFWRGASAALGLDVGAYQIDQMRPITGTLGSDLDAYLEDGVAGAFSAGAASSTRPAYDMGGGSIINLDSSLLGDHYSGDDTHPMSVICDYHIKMYGVVSDAGSISLAQLIAAMTGKLDTSVWTAAGGASLWCPSDTAISLPVPASGGTVTAPGDGWLTLYAQIVNPANAMHVILSTPNGLSASNRVDGYSPADLTALLPVRAGMVVTVYYINGASATLTFTPSVGNS